MRFPTRLLVLPFLIGYPEHAVLNAQVQPAQAPARTAADNNPVSVRWNRLVPRLVDEAAASRRAARTAAAAAGDSAALRRIAQTPPPCLFRVYTPQRRAVRGGEFRARRPRRFLRRSCRQRVRRRPHGAVHGLGGARIDRPGAGSRSRAGTKRMGRSEARDGWPTLGRGCRKPRDRLGSPVPRPGRTLERHYPERAGDVVQRSGRSSHRNRDDESTALVARVSGPVPPRAASGVRFAHIPSGTRGSPTRRSRADT